MEKLQHGSLLEKNTETSSNIIEIDNSCQNQNKTYIDGAKTKCIKKIQLCSMDETDSRCYSISCIWCVQCGIYASTKRFFASDTSIRVTTRITTT
jgi:hypothetical protein